MSVLYCDRIQEDKGASTSHESHENLATIPVILYTILMEVFMTIKQLRKALRQFPSNAKVKWNDQSIELRLKFDSEEGWIVVILPKTSN